jgi:hypothetical protein
MVALIDVVVVFVIRVACRASVVIAWCPLVQPCGYWKFFPAKFGKERALSWKTLIDDCKVSPVNIVERFLMPVEP